MSDSSYITVDGTPAFATSKAVTVGLGISQCSIAGYLSFGPMVQCVVHVLKNLACHAHVTPANSPASHCKQCSALTTPALHARGCAGPSRAR